MTRAEILAMQPGPELDAAVFELAFGKKVICWEPEWAPDGSWSIDPGGDGDLVPHYVERCHCDGNPRMRDCFTDDERRVVRETGHAIYCFERVPRLSTTGDGMLLVVESMAAKGWELELRYNGKRAIADFHNHGRCRRVKYETAPHAVAIAALLALEEEHAE